MSTRFVTEQLTVLHCADCGMTFAFTADFEARARADKRTFYCPAGHKQGYYGKNDADRLRDELAATKRRLEYEERSAKSAWDTVTKTARRLTATRGVVTRQKNRLQKGQCPCCSAKFKDLKAHMKAEHPNWEPLNHPDAKEQEATSEATPIVEAPRTNRGRLLAALTDEPQHLDTIAKASRVSYASASVELSLMAKSGEAVRSGKGMYTRALQS